jgi:hypothetical protein
VQRERYVTTLPWGQHCEVILRLQNYYRGARVFGQVPQRRTTMPRGDKSAYTDKQKRQGRWELVIVVLVPSATFWSVRHFVAQLLGWGAQAAA